MRNLQIQDSGLDSYRVVHVLEAYEENKFASCAGTLHGEIRGASLATCSQGANMGILTKYRIPNPTTKRTEHAPRAYRMRN